MSMATRYDHGLGLDGYYDHPVFANAKGTHARKLKSTLAIMRQLYEEVSGNGYYKWRKEDIVP